MSARPFEFFDLHVLRTSRISPGFARVTVGGDELHRFLGGGRDQRVKLFLPRPGQHRAAVPRGEGTGWWPAWQRMDPDERAPMRTYTVREHRRGVGELDIDFALHGACEGPASRWALVARPGAPLSLLGPTEEDNAGVDFRPPPDTERVLIAGDSSALPAIAGILDWLPAGMPARVWIETEHAADRQRLSTRADAEITWLCRDRLPAPAPNPLLAALRDRHLPPGTSYAWLAGEAGHVRALRRHLVNDRGFDRGRVTFTGYWRRDASEDTLLQEAMAA
ncbi:siderophore-interacting protein [Streptomyces hainanensis]|uniref:Siderophore-interacting protein n=1 Tax=Streptomyces hainanensis TaxID=402648 RepID=A0A4R4TDR4_9ACTN|nr:siderophore-interacting protein [Streptomyces hainanensis]TDC75487.1 siderophore-interacting protein [Streptomyces hainanensis]